MTDMTKEEINKGIAKSFFNSKEKVHISRKKRSHELYDVFRNGIIERIDNEFFIINDDIIGKETVFYSELKKDIEEFISIN